MAFLQCEGHGGLLDAWVAERGVGPTRPAALVDDSAPGLRFAFYGRTSTADHQDSASSRGWQREIAEAVIAGHGVVTDVFFDVGCSRRVPWARRPAAGALLAALRMERRFDAVVVGEYERAFASGDQFTGVAAVLAGLGVEVWLPEAGGRVDVDSPAHAALVTVLGAQSQREVLRSRHRVRAAMWTQAREQGRYLGGRPPYGYRLVDAGPHPNRAHAGWGRRLRRLDPDPVTSPHVRWIFAQRLAAQRGGHRAGIDRAESAVSVGRGPEPESASPRWGMASADGRGDPRQPALHRASGVGPATHRAHQAGRGTYSAPFGSGGVGDFVDSVASAVGDRGGVRHRAAGAGNASEPGRPFALLRARRPAAVRGVRAASGLALGSWPGRVPVPPWTLQRTSAAIGRGQEHLRP